MRKSEILKKDCDELLMLSKRMRPEERLLAYFYHSQFIYQIYRAGVSYRKAGKKQ